MRETFKELSRDLQPGEIRERLIGETMVRAYHTGGGIGIQVQARGPKMTYSKTHFNNEAAAMTDFAECVMRLEMDEIHEGDLVVAVADPGGPISVVASPIRPTTTWPAMALLERSGTRTEVPLNLITRVPLATEEVPAEGTDIPDRLAHELADAIRDTVRRHHPGGGEQYLDRLVDLAERPVSTLRLSNGVGPQEGAFVQAFVDGRYVIGASEVHVGARGIQAFRSGVRHVARALGVEVTEDGTL